MTNSGMVHHVSDACPSCATRLRIALETAEELPFSCPECGVALVAHSGSTGSVEISAFAAAPSDSPASAVDLSSLLSRFPGGSRTVAIVATFAFGMVMLTCLIPEREHSVIPGVERDGGSVDKQSGDEMVADALPIRSTVVHDETESIDPGRDFSNPEFSSVAEELTVSDIAITALSELPLDLPQPFRSDLESASEEVVGQGATGSEATPDEKLDLSIVTGDATEHPDAAPTDEPSTTVQPSRKLMSLQERMDVPINSFRQTKPMPLRDVIRIVEQMCLVRVDTSAVSEEQLSQQVAVSLLQTTPSGILTEAGQKTGLGVIVDDASVRLVSEVE